MKEGRARGMATISAGLMSVAVLGALAVSGCGRAIAASRGGDRPGAGTMLLFAVFALVVFWREGRLHNHR